MKAILGSLLCYILFIAQCFAIKGGPQYPVGSASITGTYSGVLQPNFDPTDPFSANSLGVFTLGIPTDGASTGTFLMFARGRIFGGSIQGVANPNTGTLTALIFGTFNYTLEFIDGAGMLQTLPVTASVTGALNARVTSTSNTFSSSSAVLTGAATAFISNGGVQQNGDPTLDGSLSLTVMGFKQSDTAAASGTLTPPTGTGG
ncbi:MAG: hypothetical protein H0X40_14680 [Chthoniobacterales bacterium]|nr:hypothetical protein [Chthoniobacterales bacterium]